MRKMIRYTTKFEKLRLYVHLRSFSPFVSYLTMCLFVQRLAEEKAKKKVALKRQEELEQKRLEEEARKKKIQQAVRQCSLYY